MKLVRLHPRVYDDIDEASTRESNSGQAKSCAMRGSSAKVARPCDGTRHRQLREDLGPGIRVYCIAQAVSGKMNEARNVDGAASCASRRSRLYHDVSAEIRVFSAGVWPQWGPHKV